MSAPTADDFSAWDRAVKEGSRIPFIQHLMETRGLKLFPARDLCFEWETAGLVVWPKEPDGPLFVDMSTGKVSR